MDDIVYDLSYYRTIDKFAYDIKVLYQLSGLKIDNLEMLCKKVLQKNEYVKFYNLLEKCKAHQRSYENIKIYGLSFMDMVPKDIFDECNYERRQVLELLFNKFDNMKVLDFYVKIFFFYIQMLQDISQNLALKFNFVGARTGRLSFRRGTLNLYILNKEQRKKIIAAEHYELYQFDFKSIQPRLALIEAGYDNLPEDIYSLFPGNREDNKSRFLTWMYSKDWLYNDTFKDFNKVKQLRKEIYNKADNLTNRYGRPLYFKESTDNVIFQNYITSTEVDLLLESLKAIYFALKNKQSKILFPFHDAIIIMIHDDEKDIVNDTRQIMSMNNFFPVEIKRGKNYGEMITL